MRKYEFSKNKTLINTFSMNKIIITIIFINILNITSFSQSYFTTAGARFGTDWGISVQQKVLKHTTFEAIFQSSLTREELMLTGLLEQHFPLISKRLNVYLGAGYHKGFVTDINANYDSPYGLTLIAGAEFTLARFTVSYDYKPAFNFYGGENKWYNQSGISVRYVLIQQKAFKKMRKRKEKRKRKKKRKERREDLFNRDN